MELRKLASLYIRSKMEEFLPFFFKEDADDDDIASESTYAHDIYLLINN